MDQVTNQFIGSRKNMIENLENQLKDVTKLIEGVSEPGKLDDLNKKVLGIQGELDKVKNNKDLTPWASMKELQRLNSNLKVVYEEKKVQLQAEVDAGDEKAKRAKETLDKIGAVVNMAVIAADIYQKIVWTQNSMKEVNDALDNIEMDIQKLQAFEATVLDAMVPMLNNYADALDEMEESLKLQTSVGLIVAKMNIQSTLQQLNGAISSITQGFGVGGSFLSTIQSINDGFVTLINLYERIQAYQDQQRFGQFIANVVSPGSIAIPLKGTVYEGPAYWVERVQLTNVAIAELEGVQAAFKQATFPFGPIYTDAYALPTVLDPSLESDGDLDELLAKYVWKFSSIQETLVKFRTTIGPYDKFVERGWFEVNGVPNHPFYSWENAESWIIRDLFNGKKVRLEALVPEDSSVAGIEALQFSNMGIEFEILGAGETVGKEFWRLLERMSVQMSHGGNSYYAFQDKTYVIHAQKQLLSFSFLRDADRVPMSMNDVYRKILNGDLILSPFTVWEVQLVSRPNYNDFAELQQFLRYSFHVHLTGFGKYIRQTGKGTQIPALELSKFYEVVTLPY